MLINHLLRIINKQNPIRHRFCTKYVRIIHLSSMFKRKNPVFPLPFLPPPPPPTGGREKGKEKLDFAARTLSLNKQYLHSSHQICVEKYYFFNKILHSKKYITNPEDIQLFYKRAQFRSSVDNSKKQLNCMIELYE